MDWQNYNVLEAELLEGFQNLVREPWLDEVMTLYTGLNDAGKLAIVTCVALLILRKDKRIGACASVALVLETLLVNLIFKPLVRRPRPYVINEAIDVLAHWQRDYAFPSGHTGSCFAVAGVMLLCMPKRYGIPAFLLAVLMGYSRMYVGVHYFTDVIGGAGIGMVCAVIAKKLFMR